ncbi:MAG: tetratricopeptide repeat-containing sensor histidine kinase [Candidatus Delongbacteria bacterium]|nr:tetratricopeptide repeat-containing sensor histidine kinase [Candidatus Delongbacteria bacterium]
MKKFLWIYLIFSSWLPAQSLLTMTQVKLDKSRIRNLESRLNEVQGRDKIDILIQLVYAYRSDDSSLARHYGETGINLAKALSYPQGEADLQKEMGKYHAQWKRADSARFCYFRALDIYQSIRNRTGEGIVYNYLGQNYFNEDNLTRAFEFYLKSHTVFMEIGDKERLAINANDLGIVNYYLGNYDTSIRFYLESLRLKETLGNKRSLALTRANLSDVFIYLKDYDQAASYLEMALDVADSEQDFNFRSIITSKLGSIYAKKAEFQKSEQYLTESLQISEKVNNPVSIAFAYYNLGSLYRDQLQFAKARTFYQKAWEIYRNLPGTKNGYAETLNAMGYVDGRLGNFWLAIAELEEALSIAQEIQAKPRIKDSYQYLSEIHQSLGHYREALEYRKKVQTIQDTILNLEKNRLISALNIQYETEHRENEIAHLTREKAYEKRFQWFILTLLGLSLLLVAGVYTRYRAKKTAHRLLSEKNDLINQQKEQLERSQDALKMTLSNKDKLFSIISHDLRSPFTAFLGLTEMLYRESETLPREKIRLYSQEINQAAKSQLELLEDILTWSRLQMGKIEFNPGEINLYQVVKTVLTYLKTQAAAKDIALVNQVPIGMMVWTDQNMIQLILQNLISNAIKFSYPEQSVWINGRPQNHDSLISIRDSGIGISQDGLLRIFKVDGNYSTIGTADERGTGLGLVLCRDMVERHGGRIWCESQIGKGSTFYFTLPVSAPSIPE